MRFSLGIERPTVASAAADLAKLKDSILCGEDEGKAPPVAIFETDRVWSGQTSQAGSESSSIKSSKLGRGRMTWNSPPLTSTSGMRRRLL